MNILYAMSAILALASIVMFVESRVHDGNGRKLLKEYLEKDFGPMLRRSKDFISGKNPGDAEDMTDEEQAFALEVVIAGLSNQKPDDFVARYVESHKPEIRAEAMKSIVFDKVAKFTIALAAITAVFGVIAGLN